MSVDAYRFDALELETLRGTGALSQDFEALNRTWRERGVTRWLELIDNPSRPTRAWGAFTSAEEAPRLAAFTLAIGLDAPVSRFDELYESRVDEEHTSASEVAVWYFISVTVGQEDRGRGLGRGLIRFAASSLWAESDDVDVRTLSPAVGLSDKLGVAFASERTPGLQTAVSELAIVGFHEGNGAHLEHTLVNSRMDDAMSCGVSLVFAYPRPSDAARFGQSELDLSGTTFAERYLIHRLIGQGGMGAVYRARDTKMNREVALKVLRESHAETDSGIAQFIQEAKNSSRLKHPNSIRVFDFGRTEGGFLYLAMELLEGKELTEIIAERAPMSADEVISLAQQVCKSVGEAHSLGLIHRDLKPANIFLCQLYGETDFVKVLDFGISQFIWEADSNEHKDGYIAGTATYIAPEQALEKAQGASVDVYSLGVILYEMLSGHAPFKGNTPMAIAMEHVGAPLPPFLPSLKVPQPLATLVYEMLAKQPSERPKTIEVVGERLHEMRVARSPVTSNEPEGPRLEDSTSQQSASFPTLPVLLLVIGVAFLVWRFAIAEDTAVEVERSGASPSADSALVQQDEPSPPAPSPEAQRPQQAPVNEAPSLGDAGSSKQRGDSSVSAAADVTITSAPVGAAVFEGMALLGKTPLTLIWDKATERSLTLRADGFDEATLVLSTGDGSPVPASYEVKMVPVQPAKSVKPKSRKSRKGAKRKKRPRWKDFEQ